MNSLFHLAYSIRVLVLIALLCLLSFKALAQENEGDSGQKFSCYQDKTERVQSMNEAESNHFKVNRIEIAGNTFTRHKVFMEKMFLKEDDIFTQQMLLKNVRRFSTIRAIYPIQIENVLVRLNRESKLVDLVFCVEEKRKNLGL